MVQDTNGPRVRGALEVDDRQAQLRGEDLRLQGDHRCRCALWSESAAPMDGRVPDLWIELAQCLESRLPRPFPYGRSEQSPPLMARLNGHDPSSPVSGQAGISPLEPARLRVLHPQRCPRQFLQGVEGLLTSGAGCKGQGEVLLLLRYRHLRELQARGARRLLPLRRSEPGQEAEVRTRTRIAPQVPLDQAETLPGSFRHLGRVQLSVGELRDLAEVIQRQVAVLPARSLPAHQQTVRYFLDPVVVEAG